MSLSPIKKGQTLSLDFSLSPDIGAVVSGIACVPRAADGKNVAPFSITSLGVDSSGNYHWRLVASSSKTNSWPLGSLFCDIKFTFIDGSIDYSETFQIVVDKPNTPVGA